MDKQLSVEDMQAINMINLFTDIETRVNFYIKNKNSRYEYTIDPATIYNSIGYFNFINYIDKLWYRILFDKFLIKIGKFRSYYRKEIDKEINNMINNVLKFNNHDYDLFFVIENLFKLQDSYLLKEDIDRIDIDPNSTIYDSLTHILYAKLTYYNGRERISVKLRIQFLTYGDNLRFYCMNISNDKDGNTREVERRELRLALVRILRYIAFSYIEDKLK